MVTLLLVETDSSLRKELTDVENMCHATGLNFIIHKKGEDLEELLDCLEGTLVAFSPDGNETTGSMISKFGRDVVLVVGGFKEHKNLPLEISKRAKMTVSLGKDYLSIPDIVERIIVAYEKASKK